MTCARRILAALASFPASPVLPFLRTVPWAITHRPVRWLPRRVTAPVLRCTMAAQGWWLLIDWFLLTTLVVGAFRFFLLDSLDDPILWGIIGTLVLTVAIQVTISREWLPLGVGIFGLVVGYLVIYVPLLARRHGWFDLSQDWSQALLRGVVCTTGAFLAASHVWVLGRAVSRYRTRRHFAHPTFNRRRRGRGRRSSDMTGGQFPAPSATKTDD